MKPDDPGADASRPRATLFGRRRGKRLTARHDELLLSALPGIALDPSRPIEPQTLSAASPHATWLEIGFGGGEHLAAAAGADPRALFLGCEAFRNGVAKALMLIEEQELGNIRLYEGDARAVIEALPVAALDGVYLLYPDPWPKRRQRKRRFLSDLMLTRLARIMRPGAALRFATDIDDNAGWTLARVLRAPHFSWMPRSAADWRKPWEGWTGTRYEAKALREGRRPAYFTFVRNAAPAP
ncbi:MAG: tRNA (guanine(46)-N(7))-methyltransferase TrmB [Methylocella sp.]